MTSLVLVIWDVFLARTDSSVFSYILVFICSRPRHQDRTIMNNEYVKKKKEPNNEIYTFEIYIELRQFQLEN